jgi:ATP/maltotriose-dependent transcriptional regulator MalT
MRRDADAGILDTTVGAKLVNQMRRLARETLCDRELEVLRLVAGGPSNRELGVNDRAAAVGAAFDRGLLTPGDGGN